MSPAGGGSSRSGGPKGGPGDAHARALFALLLAAIGGDLPACDREGDDGVTTMRPSAGTPEQASAALATASAAQAMAMASASAAAAQASAAMVAASASGVAASAMASALAAASARPSGILGGISGHPHFSPCPPGAQACNPQRSSRGSSGPFGDCAATGNATNATALGTFNVRAPLDEAATRASRAAGRNECCYREHRFCGGGRPLRDDDGSLVLASAVSREDWLADAPAAGAPSLASLSAHERALLSSHWLREAGYEHASVASFARFSLELLSLGAPASLLEASLRAGLDEVAHARLAYSLAVLFDPSHAVVGPGPLPAPALPAVSIARFVCDTFRDGCVAETYAAHEARIAADECALPEVRDALDRIARDEAEHAALAFRALAWALRALGPAAREALSLALDALVHDEISPLSDESPSSLSPSARSLGGARTPLERAVTREALTRTVLVPCARALLALSLTVPADQFSEGSPFATTTAPSS